MYRHFIAPARGFTQFSHEIIRHPRLSSDAVRLLTWQLSLPEGARESLSRTAERARIGACAFSRAKRELKAEGFVHERRLQGPRGRWVTQQLVSNEPLGEAEAAKLLGRMPAPVPVSVSVSASASAFESMRESAPTAEIPAVGDPAGPLTDGYPKPDRGENTSNLPPEPEPAPEPEAEASEDARALVGALPSLSPALRHIPSGMTEELARLVAAWLAAGHSPASIHTHVLRGLPKGGTPVYKPGGLLRYLLREVPPVEPAAAPAAPAGRSVSARLAGARECEGEQHIQPMLFRPVGDETFCSLCTSEPAPTPA
ncbi:hypothetical protein [Streptomyces laurentii]|uniref:hypothetical protein n=1 Tax=Streptomyces laurentii TaxID=39478 RepID=UPI00368B5D62